MKRPVSTIVVAMLLLAAMAAVSRADIISLKAATLEGLLGDDAPGPIGDMLITDMSNGKLHAEVRSQAFESELGDYVCLYQINNIGARGDSAVEMFTLDPFIGAGDEPVAGWIASVPTGFIDDSQLPEDKGYIDEYNVVSFYFTARAGASITPGEHSAVLYIVSTERPGRITGNLIGANVGSGDVVGPLVPEPSTLVLIGMGLVALVLRRRIAR
jgi:hypothetical protein